jgi:pimeloyl-ACP methyl ester carboxylesterase
VGHSLGATHALILAAESPDLVAGLVLLDPPPIELMASTVFPFFQRTARGQTAWFRDMAVMSRNAGDESAAIYFETVASEHESLFDPDVDAQCVPESLGEISLTVISSDLPNPALGALAELFQRLWIGSNREMATRSRHGRFVLTQGSTHQIHIDAPETVSRAVFDLLD